MDKATLRKHLKQDLKAIVPVMDELSQKVSANLLSLIPQIVSQIGLTSLPKLGVYMPCFEEPKWFVHFGEEYQYLLVHMHKELKLSFHPVSLAKIKAQAYDLELASEDRMIRETPDIILIPGLGFSEARERIGRGRGYFDHYLKNFSGVKIGVGFEMQVVKDVCSEEHDIKMDYLVTEKNIRGKI